MKSDVLKEQGLTDEQIKFVMAENGKDIEKLKSDLNSTKTELEKWKADAETATETLKKFEDVDVDAIKSEVEAWKKKAEDADATYKNELYKRDFNDALAKELDAVKFSSESAKKSIMAEIADAGLKLSDGKILGLNDLISQIKEKDSSAFVSEDSESKPHFTTPRSTDGNMGSGSTLTKKEIMAIKDTTERQRAIAQNIGLFSSQGED